MIGVLNCCTRFSSRFSAEDSRRMYNRLLMRYQNPKSTFRTVLYYSNARRNIVIFQTNICFTFSQKLHINYKTCACVMRTAEVCITSTTSHRRYNKTELKTDRRKGHVRRARSGKVRLAPRADKNVRQGSRCARDILILNSY